MAGIEGVVEFGRWEVVLNGTPEMKLQAYVWNNLERLGRYENKQQANEAFRMDHSSGVLWNASLN